MVYAQYPFRGFSIYPLGYRSVIGKIEREITSHNGEGILSAGLVERERLGGLEARATSIFPTTLRFRVKHFLPVVCAKDDKNHNEHTTGVVYSTGNALPLQRCG